MAIITGVKSLASLQCSIYVDWENVGTVDSRAESTSETIKPNLFLKKPRKLDTKKLRGLSRVAQKVSGRFNTRN